MPYSPKLNMPYLVEGQNQGEITHNDALNHLDSLSSLSVLDRDLSAAPGAPSNGDAYLINGAGSGAWTGHTDEVAMYYDGWLFSTPVEGLRMWVADEDVYVIYDGATWVTISYGGAQYFGNSWDYQYSNVITAPPGG